MKLVIQYFKCFTVLFFGQEYTFAKFQNNLSCQCKKVVSVFWPFWRDSFLVFKISFVFIVFMCLIAQKYFDLRLRLHLKLYILMNIQKKKRRKLNNFAWNVSYNFVPKARHPFYTQIFWWSQQPNHQFQITHFSVSSHQNVLYNSVATMDMKSLS